MKNLDLNNDRTQARNSVLIINLLVAVASLVVIAGWYFMHNINYWQWYWTALLSISCAIFFAASKPMPVRISGAASTLVLVAALFANTLTNYQLAISGVPFEPFGGYKLAPIAIAIIAPSPVWIGTIVIGICALAPLVLYHFIIPLELKALLPAQEPWNTCLYSVVAFFVLRYRLKGLQIERTMARLKAEHLAHDDLARIFLGLRDLTNTPLQSIELTAQLLRKNQISAAEGATHLDRIMIRLRELSQVLMSYEMDVDWFQTESSFDAVVEIQKRINPKKSKLPKNKTKI